MERIRCNRERESVMKIASCLVLMALVCAAMFRLCPVFGLSMALFYLVGVLAIVLPAVSNPSCRSGQGAIDYHIAEKH